MEALFSYGTLQQSQVQLDNFGRLLDGDADSLVGYRLGQIKITDTEVLKSSGKAYHPILIHTANPDDEVAGTVFMITELELIRADRYEVADYVRQAAILKSGKTCWIYAASDSATLVVD
ncbi:gamma-glutamylcyclotransferase family protein [Pseudoalteromonas sp. OOF1S-7]|uniref:gamma-glutamylcyclotransferase family protein n=1 Tax=Pseudoalteromonas sp. OOF1S-7 TaxID=2917757 RepID=UPI001EF6D1DC|nr:gamma-glutamylcyclotransferase family protein [Pseudoalteromonas sp. OOF1S-7]MCG7534303.1 gamma-glutamylcyclotransferase [Pseudoalteromonas sp. OOF1S-7]